MKATMFGVVLALFATATSAEGRCRSGYAGASAKLQVADRAAARRNFSAANRALDEGLRALGNAYAPPRMMDDSGMHLVVAWDQERKGRLKNAAAIKRRILVDRMSLCHLPAR